MLGFFTDPYPEELLYSALARYSKRVRYLNRQAVIKEVFGKKGLAAIVDFPTRLESLIKILPANHNYSVEEFINRNTLFPFFKPFLSSERAKIVQAGMRYAVENNIPAQLGVKVNQILSLNYLRFCPVCVEEDRKQYEETYWHRIHQLAGVLICPEHLCFLENSLLRWGRESSSSFQTAEEYIFPVEPRFIGSQDENHKILLKIAKDAQWLISQDKLQIETEIIRERYFNLLLKQGFAYYSGRVKHNKFLTACQNFFSPKLFEMIGRVSKRDSWISILVQVDKTDVIFHPIRHLLLMTFLGVTAEEFFTSFVEYKPFGDPPYPCLNKAANHFGEMRIKKYQILENQSKDEKKKGCPVAIFSCDCGFIYQRIGPDKAEEDKFSFSLVREYGILWETKLAELWKDLTLSSSQIGKQLGISQVSVCRHAIRLNLPMNTENTRSLQGYNRHRNPNKSFSQMRQNYRDEWLEVIKNNPDLTRQELTKVANFLYLWLRRNDSNWLEEHLPPVNKVPRNKETLDWKRIDEELSAEVENICDEILNIKTFPVRVCITEIISRSGYKTWLEKRGKKLPLTNELMSQKLESLEDFMIRKINWAKEEFLREGKIPTKPQFEIKAVVRNKTSRESEKIQSAINEALKGLRNL